MLLLEAAREVNAREALNACLAIDEGLSAAAAAELLLLLILLLLLVVVGDVVGTVVILSRLPRPNPCTWGLHCGGWICQHIGHFSFDA